MESFLYLFPFGFGIFAIFAFFIGIASFIVWLAALVHSITNKNLPDGEKIIWALIIFFTQILGAILYYIFVIHQKKYDTFSSILNHNSNKKEK